DLSKIADDVNARHIQLVMTDGALRGPGVAEADIVRITEPSSLRLFDPLEVRRLKQLPPMVDIDVIAKRAVAPSDIGTARFRQYPRREAVEKIEPCIRRTTQSELLGNDSEAFAGEGEKISPRTKSAQQL